MRLLLALVLLKAFLSVVSSFRRFHSVKLLSLFDTNNDFIDAEILSEPSIVRKSTDKEPSGVQNFFASAMQTVTGGIERIKQIKETRDKKDKYKKEMNSMIDKAFAGTGLLGGIAGTVVKQIGSLVSDSLQKTADDFSVVQSYIASKLEGNDTVQIAVGNVQSLGMPMTASTSSSNINGKITKQFYYVFRIQGDRGAGMLTTQGSLDERDNVAITQMILQIDDGRTVDLGRFGDRRGTGVVIDVDAIG